MERDDPAYPGQREYTPLFLKMYDPLILGFFTPVVWRCPTTRLVDGYRRHLGHRHLDVGPGTGYFLERAGMPDGSPVTLLDPNVHVLDHASRRLQRLDITTVQADVCKPLPGTTPPAQLASSMKPSWVQANVRSSMTLPTSSTAQAASVRCGCYALWIRRSKV